MTLPLRFISVGCVEVTRSRAGTPKREGTLNSPSLVPSCQKLSGSDGTRLLGIDKPMPRNTSDSDGRAPICGALGCTDSASYRIKPRHTEVVVCPAHAKGHQTLGVVGSESQ